MRSRVRRTSWKYRAARKMSRNKSWPEKILWARLRDKQLGVTFYSQKVLLGYIADFWCARAKLVVEVDGSQHLKPNARVWDKQRDLAMAGAGIKTVRFTAKEVCANSAAVAAMIRQEVEARVLTKRK